MSSRRVLNQICRERNKDRHVDELKNYHASEFCSCTKGKFLITGGSAYQRNRMLIEYIDVRRQYENIPIVIVSTSADLENDIIDYMRQKGGTLSVFSERYRTYSGFYGMDDASVIELLIKTAELNGLTSAHLMASYAKSFLSLLRSCNYAPYLDAMARLANNNADDLSRVAARNGLRREDVETLSRDKEGFRLLKLAIGFVQQALLNLSPLRQSCPRSLLSVFGSRDIVFLNVNSVNQRLMNEILASELNKLSNRRMLLIFDEVPLANSEKMRLFLEAVNISQTVDFGISLENAVAWQKNANISIAKKSIAIFPDGMDNESLEELLKGFGTYTHYWVEQVVPTKRFELLHNVTYQIASETRDRVRLTDTNDSEVILHGHRGRDVILAEQLISQFKEV